jgi:microcystin degradation protein MlrC
MRIAVGGMNHESNTFNPIITGPEDFAVFLGEEILSRGMLPGYASRGIIEALQAEGCAIAPLVLARAVANGVVSAAFYGYIKDECVRRLREALAAGPIDGICLALHGSMKAEGLGCADEDLALALRAVLPGVPMTVALDMHATVTGGLLEAAQGFAGYKTAPHVDCEETGALAAGMLLESLRTGREIYTACRKIPTLIAGEKSESSEEPMISLLAACRRLETRPGIMAASLLLGFPWADDGQNGVSILVSALGKDEAAIHAAELGAEELANLFQERRREFVFHAEYYDPPQAMEAAFQAVLVRGERPVFVSDSGDNPTAGATGDATDMLETVLQMMDTVDRLPTPLLYSGFYDAPAAAACMNAGIGAELNLTLGGNWDTVNGRKIPLCLRVKNIVRDFGPYKSGLVLAAHRNILFTITSKHIGFGDEDLLPALGISPGDYCLVLVKLGYLEPCFKSIAARAILATSRGCSDEILERVPYKRLRPT